MTWTAEEAAQELLQVLPLLNRIVAAELREATDDKITMPQFRVLTNLRGEAQTLSVLASQRRVSLQAMSELVQSLVKRGLIDRTPDPRDRRQQLLQLTDLGKIQLQAADEKIMLHMIPLMTDLSAEERRAVEQALGALRRVLAQDEQEGTVARPEVLQV